MAKSPLDRTRFNDGEKWWLPNSNKNKADEKKNRDDDEDDTSENGRVCCLFSSFSI